MSVVTRFQNKIGLHVAGGVSLGLIGAAVMIAAVLPARNARQDDLQIARSLIQVSRMEQAARQRLDQELEEFQQLGADAREILGRIQAEPQLDAFLAGFAQLVKEHGASIDYFQPLERRVGEQAAAQNVRCRISGDWAALVQILANLEQLPQLVWVERIRFSSTSEGTLRQCDLDFAVVFVPKGTTLHAIQQQLVPTSDSTRQQSRREDEA